MLENFSSLKLNHGLMEMGYVDHLHKNVDFKNSDPGQVDHAQGLSVSMTATMDAAGNLFLGKILYFLFLLYLIWLSFLTLGCMLLTCCQYLPMMCLTKIQNNMIGYD